MQAAWCSRRMRATISNASRRAAAVSGSSAPSSCAATRRAGVVAVGGVAGVPPRRDAGGVVFEADAGDDLERLAQGGRSLGLERAELLRRDEAVECARDRDAVREGVKAREIRDRDHAALLEVEAL